MTRKLAIIAALWSLVHGATSCQENRQPFSIIYDQRMAALKRSVTVRLKEKVSKAELERIAYSVKSSSPTAFDRTFILYYLPGQKVGTLAWATTHFDPTLWVDTLGSPSDAPALQSDGADSKGEVLGNWSYAGPPESLIILLRRANETLVERRFRDKSIVELPVTTKHEESRVIIRPIERNLSGDYILDEEGNLRLMDSAGFIGMAIASKQNKPGAND